MIKIKVEIEINCELVITAFDYNFCDYISQLDLRNLVQAHVERSLIQKAPALNEGSQRAY